MQTKRLVTELARNRLCVWACLFPRGDKPKFLLRGRVHSGRDPGSPEMDLISMKWYLSGPLLLQRNIKIIQAPNFRPDLPFIKLKTDSLRVFWQILQTRLRPNETRLSLEVHGRFSPCGRSPSRQSGRSASHVLGRSCNRWNCTARPCKEKRKSISRDGGYLRQGEAMPGMPERHSERRWNRIGMHGSCLLHGC